VASETDQHPIAVIGAGIAGISCASFLQRDGHRVVVIDPRDPGTACSFGNAGMISPGQCIPAALPGMLAKVPKWLSDPLGPLAVKPAYFPRALPWLLRWIRAGRMDQVRRSAVAMRALHGPVFDLYRELLGAAKMAELIRVKGQLYVWRTLEPSATERIADALRIEHGVRAEPIPAEQLRQMEPDLAPDYKRGLFFPDNGYTINPGRLVQTLAEDVARGGGRFVKATARGVAAADGRVTAVETEVGAVPVSGVVISAGAWSDDLARHVGNRLPIESERGYHVMLPHAGIDLRNKISNRNDLYGMTPMEHGVRISGTVEIAGRDAPMDERRAQVMLTQARRMFPALRDEGMSIWMGCRPSLPDSLPVIDRSARYANAWLACGHSHFGMTGGPMTGRVLADLVAGRPSAIDRAPYRASRF